MGTGLFGERIEQIPDGAASFTDFHPGQFAVLPDFVAVAHRIIRFGEHVDMDIDNGGIAQGPPCSHGAGACSASGAANSQAHYIEVTGRKYTRRRLSSARPRRRDPRMEKWRLTW